MSPVDRALRLAATIEPSPDRARALRTTVEGGIDWVELIDRAEGHGLAPLLRRNLAAAAAAVPDDHGRRHGALAVRHRHAHGARAEALAELARWCEEASLPLVVLKGMMLADLVYPAPELRPMRDIDVLVDHRDAPRLVTGLASLGYRTPARHANPYMGRHHHLPPAEREHDGLLVSVEVHTDALSGDAPEHLTLARVSRPPVPLVAGDAAALRLDHVDNLRHLHHHGFEPTGEMRLINALDLVLYADRFAAEIDWEWVERRYPYVPNTLRLVHYLLPLPERVLASIGGAPTAPAPAGVGHCMEAPSRIARAPRLRERLEALLDPSDWWLHAVYAVPPGRSLGIVRWLRHPRRLLAALVRRLYSRLRPVS